MDLQEKDGDWGCDCRHPRAISKHLRLSIPRSPLIDKCTTSIHSSRSSPQTPRMNVSERGLRALFAFANTTFSACRLFLTEMKRRPSCDHHHRSQVFAIVHRFSPPAPISDPQASVYASTRAATSNRCVRCGKPLHQFVMRQSSAPAQPLFAPRSEAPIRPTQCLDPSSGPVQADHQILDFVPCDCATFYPVKDSE